MKKEATPQLLLSVWWLKLRETLPSKFPKIIPKEPSRGVKTFDMFLTIINFVEHRFEGAGYSLSGTKEVLSSIASDCMVDDGECLNAAEIFWTPSERSEVLTRRDMMVDFPEIIDL